METRTLSTADFRKELAESINRALYAHERTIITRDGKPVAALVSFADLKALQADQDEMDAQRVESALDRLDAGEEEATSYEAFSEELLAGQQ